VWRKVIPKDELEAYRARHAVILTRLIGGRTVIHVVSETPPGDGFEGVKAGLEDLYFATLATRRRAA
jgi:hypothetical protein